MLPPAAIEAQREREGVGEVCRGGGRQAIQMAANALWRRTHLTALS